MKGRWHCPHPKCDQSSSRHWNLKVHIIRKHGGLGQPITDALLSPPSPQFAPDMNWGNNSSYHHHNYHPNDPLALHHRKEQALHTKSDPFDEISRSISKTVEWARPLAEWKELVEQTSSAAQWPFSQGNIPLGNTLTQSFVEWLFFCKRSFTAATDPLKDKIVAYKGIVCKSCLACVSLPTYRFDETGIEVEAEHVCDDKRISKMQGIVGKERQIMIEDLQRKLPGEIETAARHNNNT